MGRFVTGEAARERLCALLLQVDVAYREMRELSCDEVGTAFRVELAQRLEAQERVNRGLMYRVFGQIADPPDEAAMVPDVVQRLCARLRIPPRGQTARQIRRQDPAASAADRTGAATAAAGRG